MRVTTSILLIACNALLVLANANPEAVPNASPAALAEPSPDTLAEPAPDALAERNSPSSPTCPFCPPILKQVLAPLASSPFAQQYCMANGTNSTNTTDYSVNPTWKYYGDLFVKEPRQFCCCLFPMTNGSSNCTNSTSGGGGKRGKDRGRSLFRRMWRAWSGEKDDLEPVTLVDNVTKDVTVYKPRRVHGGSLARHHGFAIKVKSHGDVDVMVEIPEESL